ncbi:hypothetical protein AAG906_033148 [Vitis piasezkii]
MQKVPYASAVDSLTYVMVCTRPDIAHVVGVAAVKWILKYLRGTSKTCLCFGTNKLVLVGCTDADMVGDIDSERGAVSWQSRLQKCIALSNTEAKYIAITEASKELLWMKKFLQELGIQRKKGIYYTVIVRVLFISVRIQLFTLDQSILM